MGSDLYSVKLAARKGTTVKLEVKIVHPDVVHMGLPPDRSFALMLLYDIAGDKSALRREVSLDDITDGKWMKQYAAGFITEAKGGVKKGTSARMGSLEITVSHPAWIEHLVKGKNYDSRAYPNAKSYDRCAPIAPGAGGSEEAEEGEDGFIVVPKAVFADYVAGVRDCPEVFSIPAYGDKGYLAVDTVEGAADLKKIRSWAGRAVQAGDDNGSLLLTGPKACCLLVYRDGSRGMRGMRIEDPIGLIALRKGVRKKTKIAYQKVLDDMPGVVCASEVNGKEVTLTLQYGPRSAGTIRSETDALWILARGLPGWDYYDLKGTHPLARALRADALDTLSRWQEMLPAWAKKYVAGFTLEKPGKLPKVPDLEKMGLAEAKAFFLSHPFGRVSLKIRVTDPKWVAHFKPGCYYRLQDWAMPKPGAVAAG